MPIALLFFLLLTCTPTHVEAKGPHLTLRNGQNETVFQKEMREEQCFGIRFIHSVAKSPVEDWYCIHEADLYLEKTIYEDFGAGLPHNADPGQRMHFEKGKIVIDGFHRKLPEFTVRVGRIAEHTLLFPQDNGQHQEIDLKKLATPGSPLTFTLER